MKKVVTFGEVMMRLAAPGNARLVQANHWNICYAGSEANVAVGVSRLGIPSAFASRFPLNDLGEAALRSIRQYGVDTQHIVRGEERMGVYFLETGSMHRSSRIVYDRTDSAFAHIKPGMIDWRAVLSGAGWFHWSGITPAISEGAAATCLEAVTTAASMGLVVSGDINYRRNLWQYGKSPLDIMPALIQHTQVVCAAPTDIQNCTGIQSTDFAQGASKLAAAYPSVKTVLAVERETINASHNKIMGLGWDAGQKLSSRTFDLTHIVDRIGAGDAFMAGYIAARLKGLLPQDQLEFAAAACALKHAIEGDVLDVSWPELEHLVRDPQAGKLLR